MLTWVINLDRSTDRMSHMAVSRIGVAFERLAAVDGRTLAPTYLSQFKSMLPAQIGAFLSHQMAWRRLVEQKASHAIVLEDDIHIAPSLAASALSTDWIPRDAGVVRFETALWAVQVDQAPHSLMHGSALRRMRSFQPGAAAYLISIEAARFLLDRVRPSEPIDDAMFCIDEPWRTLPIVYQIDPAVCIQDMFVPAQHQDPRFASMVPNISRPPKSIRLVRQGRRYLRRAKIAIDKAAAAVGAKPAFSRKVIPFGDE